jgi:hypothetical protein
MAGGVIGSSSGKDYPGNLTCKVLVTCIVAAMGGLIFGYDLGISGNINYYYYSLFNYHVFISLLFISFDNPGIEAYMYVYIYVFWCTC